MSDKGDASKSDALAWQKTNTSAQNSSTERNETSQDDTPQPETENPKPSEVVESTDNALLKETASKFLEDPSIRSASPERKRMFLRTKGVKEEDIDTLLGKPEVNAEEDTSAFTQSVLPQASKPHPPKQPSMPSAPAPRDIPPIVTYPEFLTQSTKPPPLITVDRILNTAYITGGVAASIYGLSKFIVSPMIENLTTARHELASHTQSQLDKLNGRLAEMVSIDPTISLTNANGEITSVMVDGEGDISDTDSDPTELFHRDIGTQTSPSLSRRNSTFFIPNETVDESSVEIQSERLKSLTAQLEELKTCATSNATTEDGLNNQVRELSSYLNDMRFQSSAYYGGSGIYGGASFGMNRERVGNEDAIDALKNEIRGVKGVLLSARNFPAGGVRTMGRVTG